MAEKRLLVTAPAGKGSGKKWLIAAVAAAAVVVFALIFSLPSLSSRQGNVALVKISGHISSGEGFLETSAKPDDIIGMLEKADEDARVKAILLEINSPGGSPVASEELMKAVKATKKPTAAVIRDIGTSGAYWVASASDYVIASPVSLTGSVGVTASYLEFSELLNQYGVRYERLVSAEHKDIGSPYRNLTAEEKTIAQEALAKMHNYFLSSVTENRQLTDTAAIDKISTAIVFLGSEAKELGLVDELGGKKEAEAWLKQQSNLTGIKYVTYEKKPLFDIGTLLAKQSAAAGSALGKSFLATFSGQADANIAGAKIRT
ncbi:signal peptide peptidase SppA [Candidatus Woesearchaeota archaeon]|nr:signal peptide peptidase SppA [Candidatus Woesearchaeota archaeon]